MWLKIIEGLLHIETLVFIFIIFCVAYVCFSGKASTLEDKAYVLIRAIVENKPLHLLKNKNPSSTWANKPVKKYKSEERCREIFEGIFKCEFISIRPDWLKNPRTGLNLELDGFNADVKTPIGKGLAFEYDGEQHAKYNRHFHGGDPTKFVNQVKNDAWKSKRCHELGILLIRIPHTVPREELDRYIVQELQRYKLV